MSKRFRLFIAIGAVSVAIGLAVALAPIFMNLQGFAQGSHCSYFHEGTYPEGSPMPAPYCLLWVQAPEPEWTTGFVTVIVTATLITGLLLSTRALSGK
ncbi:MAG: hypothetical protein ACHQ01_07980 [Candidatus Limnocylindrales bacterium]